MLYPYVSGVIVHLSIDTLFPVVFVYIVSIDEMIMDNKTLTIVPIIEILL